MNKPVTTTPTLRERIIAVLRENREVRNIGALADELEAALSAQVQDVADKVEVHYAHCCSGSTKYCDCVNKNHGTAWLGSNEVGSDYIPLAAAPAKQEGRRDLGQLEIHLQKLITEKPQWAQRAAIDDHTRMWFVAELISQANGRIPLLEIEGLVSRHLATMEGGEA